MLVLSRKTSEALVLNPRSPDTIRVVIMRVAGNRVTIGIDAPDGVRIVREEILDQPQERDDGPRS